MCFCFGSQGRRPKHVPTRAGFEAVCGRESAASTALHLRRVAKACFYTHVHTHVV